MNSSLVNSEHDVEDHSNDDISISISSEPDVSSPVSINSSLKKATSAAQTPEIFLPHNHLQNADMNSSSISIAGSVYSVASDSSVLSPSHSLVKQQEQQQMGKSKTHPHLHVVFSPHEHVDFSAVCLPNRVIQKYVFILHWYNLDQNSST